jgi:hypothetical protein
MSFYGSPRHLELTGNLSVVTTLQKQFDDLLFTRAQPNRLFVHRSPLNESFSPTDRAVERYQIP